MTQFKYEGLAPVGGPSGLKGLAEMMRPKIASMLPKHITPERMLKALFLAASKTPALFSCTQESLIKSLMDASSLGLDCSGTLGSAYLVPFQNRKKNVTECQLIPGYRGLIDLARRSNEISSIEAHPVYAQDQFEVSFGTNPVLVHKPYLKPDRKPQYICFYAVATLKDGSKQIEVMTLADVEKIRGMSKMGTSGPWKDHFDEMGRKTVVRRIVKYLPMSAELEKALQLDNEADGFDVNAIDVESIENKNRTEDLANRLESNGEGDQEADPEMQAEADRQKKDLFDEDAEGGKGRGRTKK